MQLAITPGKYCEFGTDAGGIAHRQRDGQTRHGLRSVHV